MTEEEIKDWAKKALVALVSHIKNYTSGDKYITYGDLGSKIGFPEPYQGNLFGSQIGEVLGAMGHMIDDIIVDGEPVPMIQSLVVSSSKKIPSDGLKEFSPTYPNLSLEKKERFRQKRIW